VPIFGTSEIRNAKTDTSVVRSVNIRYIDLSKDRNADLDNLDTRKSITHTPHRKTRFPRRGNKTTTKERTHNNKQKKTKHRVTHTNTTTVITCTNTKLKKATIKIIKKITHRG